MNRTQVQIPDRLHEEAKRVARQQEMSFAELVRRGLEHMVRLYPAEAKGGRAWEPPPPLKLGPFLAPVEDWREVANSPPESD